MEIRPERIKPEVLVRMEIIQDKIRKMFENMLNRYQLKVIKHFQEDGDEYYYVENAYHDRYMVKGFYDYAESFDDVMEIVREENAEDVKDKPKQMSSKVAIQFHTPEWVREAEIGKDYDAFMEALVMSEDRAIFRGSLSEIGYYGWDKEDKEDNDED